MTELFINALMNELPDFLDFIFLFEDSLLDFFGLFFVLGSFCGELDFEFRYSFGNMFGFRVEGREFILEDFVEGFGDDFDFGFLLDPFISEKISESYFESGDFRVGIVETVDGEFFKLLDSGENIVFGLLDLFPLSFDVVDGGIECSNFVLELLDDMLEFGLVVGD